MKITLLGQGYEPESVNAVGKHLMQLLSQTCFHTFTGISAFASEAGILGLSNYIETAKKNFKNINLIVGIDQEGTSKEALNEIKNLKINSFIFYQEEPPIFHPKIYLFEGNNKTKLILGSSNLTARGLFGNVESSLFVEFSGKDAQGNQLLTELKHYYKGLFKFNDPNLFKISETTIQDFIDRGIVPGENTRTKKYGKRPTEGKSNDKQFDTLIPKRPTAKIPKEFRGKSKTDPRVKKILDELETSDILQFELGSLVWQKKDLPNSDAQQVSGNTAITGVIRLGDANYKIDGEKIDRNTYFRNSVFGDLTWTSELRTNNSPLQVTKCKFNITIEKVNLGEHELKISHDPDRISGQHNIPTTIHWGAVLNSYLKKNNITGKTLNLYYPAKDGNLFSIVIE
ncbi:MAG: phospholipase D family protein [Bacteroidales bacterium]